MKKTLLVAAFALAGSFAFAQKPTTGNKTAEVNLNFQTGTAPIGYNLPAELRLRYFLSENSAVRVRFGAYSKTDKSSVANGAGDVTAEITDKSGFGLSITPGYEMHFAGTKKLSPYAGAQLGIGFGTGASREVTNSDKASPNAGDVTSGNSYSKKDGSEFNLMLGLMMGADYYITDGIFIGGEFGFGLLSMKSTGEGETIAKTGAAELKGKTLKTSTTELFGVSTGGVRLGFVF